MRHPTLRWSTATLAALLVLAAAHAHHPPRFERCVSLTLAGTIERVQWANPHVQVSIRSETGMNHDLIWLNQQLLSLAGIERETLGIGDRVVVIGTKRADDAGGALLLSEIRRDTDGWRWAQPPQGC